MELWSSIEFIAKGLGTVEITALNIILAIIILAIVPVLVGNTICGIAGIDIKVSSSFVTGYIGIWSLFQLVIVPLVLLKQSFSLVVAIVTGAIVGVSIYGIARKYYSVKTPIYGKMTEKLAFICMCLVVLALLAVTALMQHTDADDSRFVVNAVDIVRTNKMFLTNPATGQAIDIWEGELVKDITSPWAVFIAYCSKMTGIQATIVAHTFLPIVLTLIMCIVYWMLSDIFFKDDVTYRSIFSILAILLNVYGYYSIYSAETFAITRIWQGKAVVASIGIPLIYLISMKIYENDTKNGYYALLYMMSFAMCLMSGMGIIIGAVMIGCIALVYGIMKKSFMIFFKLAMPALPCAVYFIIYSVEKGLV